MKIGMNCIVSVRYRLLNDRDELLDESPEDQPLVYLHGSAGVLPALETALVGKQGGDEFDVSVSPADGFGEHQPGLIQTVERSAFPASQPIDVGMQITVQTEQGQRPAVVTALDESTVTIDANHPLAGMNLRFVGSINEVREATEQEIIHWPNPVPDTAQN